MKILWEAPMQSRPKLQQDILADVAIIGGGMAGVLTAYRLQKHGIKPVILEAGRTGDGMSKVTTAKITSQHGLIYDYLIGKFGKKKARQYAQANQAAIDAYQHIIHENNISCHFERRDAYLFSKKDEYQIKSEVTAARDAGLPAVFTKDVELPFKVAGAVRFSDQAQFHPMEFLSTIAPEVTIYEQSPVQEIKGPVVSTEEGSITAKKIIITTHYPILNAPGYYFLRMYQEREYVLALEHAQKLDGMYLSVDEDGHSFRNYDRYLLFGGEAHHTSYNRDGGRYKMLKREARRLYPDCTTAYEWSAQDCMTLDRVPYIGKYSASTDDMYVATGFNKWGMTSSMVSAMILTDLITGTKNEFADVFSPQRMSVTTKRLMEEGSCSVSGLVLKKFKVPVKELCDLENGTGGVIDYYGNKVGVYKDENGEVFAVSTKCPHMGCELEWNPDDLAWECPCHGSRFDYRGNILNTPATKGCRVQLK